jgi:hypothetical protein
MSLNRWLSSFNRSRQHPPACFCDWLANYREIELRCKSWQIHRDFTPNKRAGAETPAFFAAPGMPE